MDALGRAGRASQHRAIKEGNKRATHLRTAAYAQKFLFYVIEKVLASGRIPKNIFREMPCDNY
jgi:hypothetical protein